LFLFLFNMFVCLATHDGVYTELLYFYAYKIKEKVLTKKFLYG